MSDWVILRTSGRHTLPLASSLNAARFECWTPITQIRKRQRTGARVEIPAPLMPTWVFSRSAHLSDLLELSSKDGGQHPQFSVQHVYDRIPLLSDTDLDGLRRSEAKRARHKPRSNRVFAKGDSVRLTEGPFAGMSGIVQRSDGKWVMVTFDGRSVKIATFLLHPSEERRAA